MKLGIAITLVALAGCGGAVETVPAGCSVPDEPTGALFCKGDALFCLDRVDPGPAWTKAAGWPGSSPPQYIWCKDDVPHPDDAASSADVVPEWCKPTIDAIPQAYTGCGVSLSTGCVSGDVALVLSCSLSPIGVLVTTGTVPSSGSVGAFEYCCTGGPQP